MPYIQHLLLNSSNSKINIYYLSKSVDNLIELNQVWGWGREEKQLGLIKVKFKDFTGMVDYSTVRHSEYVFYYECLSSNPVELKWYSLAE